MIEGLSHYFIRRSQANNAELTVFDNLLSTSESLRPFFEWVFEIVNQVNLFDIRFMDQTVVEICPRGNSRPQAGLDVSAISLHPEGPRCPHWPTVFYVVWNVKHCVDCERTHRKARWFVLIVYSKISEF